MFANVFECLVGEVHDYSCMILILFWFSQPISQLLTCWPFCDNYRSEIDFCAYSLMELIDHYCAFGKKALKSITLYRLVLDISVVEIVKLPIDVPWPFKVSYWWAPLLIYTIDAIHSSVVKELIALSQMHFRPTRQRNCVTANEHFVLQQIMSLQ